MTTGRPVMVAMSGGVDSSVAAALLLDAGHEVVGVTMKLWGGPSDTGCCAVSDVDDARRVADRLGILGLAVVIGMLLMAIFAPWLAPYDPTERVGTPFQPPSADHLLGTNDVGQDLLDAYNRDGIPACTPNIDALAERGVVFLNTWATPIWARGSVMPAWA